MILLSILQHSKFILWPVQSLDGDYLLFGYR